MKPFPFRRGGGARDPGSLRLRAAIVAAGLVALLVGVGDAEAAVTSAARHPGDASNAALLAVARNTPEGAPDVEVLFVSWSADPPRRMATLRIDGGGTTIVREGQYVDGTMLKVLSIFPEGVGFGFFAEAYRVPAKRH